MPEARNVIERGLLIGGKSVPASSGKLADDVSPWDGEIYARVAAGTPADITRAADAAEAAFPSWSKVGAFERREIFLMAADVMAKRGAEAIAALAQETGASRVFSQFNLAFCIQVLREAAAAITRPMGELLPTSIPGAYSMAQRIPLGVVGAISPWNAPLVLGIRSIAIPLAVGNTVVMKPSEDAPITCGLLLADVLAEAGLPAGVLNVVTNDPADAGDVVAALIADPRVRMVNFTGSTNVGRIIGVQAAQHLKPAVLELGGKNPLIVLEDADPDLAVDAAVFGAFMNSGQICMSTDRIIIHKSLVETFVPRYVERVKALPVGDPADPATIVGPLINTRGAQRVSALVKDAAAKGASLLTGDGSIGGPNGTLISPVVLTDVTPDMDIFASVIFGPATVIHPVDSIPRGRELADLEQVQAERVDLGEHAVQGRPVQQSGEHRVRAVPPLLHRREREQHHRAKVPVDPDPVQRWCRVHEAMVWHRQVSPHRRNPVTPPLHCHPSMYRHNHLHVADASPAVGWP